MMAQDSLFEYVAAALKSLAPQLPLLVVWAIIFVVALVKWPRHPRASMMAAIAVVILLFIRVIASVAYLLIPRILDVSDLPLLYFGLSFIFSLLSAFAWLLVLGAIYMNRDPERSLPEKP